MKFGEIPPGEALGAILAHGLRLDGRALKKGHVLTAADIAALDAAGRETVMVARPEPGDLLEDEAAATLAAAVAGPGLRVEDAFTGRANLFAGADGVLVVDRAALDRFNLIDEAITLATLAPGEPVAAGRMVATLKIIPFAVPGATVDACLAAVAGEPPARLAEFREIDVALVQTRLPGTKESVLDKTARITRDRLARFTGRLVREERCEHTAGALTGALATVLARPETGLVLIVGASAITDRRDVVPAALAVSGGVVDHFGMPVDPGNLLLLGHAGDRPVLGLPGCARSPRPNGVDLVLARLFAGLPTGGAEIMRMGPGGLLTETRSRPQPRRRSATATAAAPPLRVAALVLAAGQSRRMGRINKLLASIDGVAMVARVVDAALASRADPVVVVTGHEAVRVVAALDGRAVSFVHNPDYPDGLSTSLAHGLAALPAGIDGALVSLGDMPGITAGHLDRLLDAFEPAAGAAICVPVHDGRRGNPVLWARRFFAEMQVVAGDVGARHLIGAHADEVREVAMDDDAVLMDVDSPDALAALEGGSPR